MQAMWARGLTSRSLKSAYEKIQPLITKKPVLSDVPSEIGAVTWIKARVGLRGEI